MRKTIIAAALLFAALAAKAQEVSYALPKTTISVEVTYTQDIFHAGKYAKYAKDLLGLEVGLKDTVVTDINQFKLRPRVEADQSKRYSIILNSNTRPALLALTEHGLVAGGEADGKGAPQGRTTAYHKPAPKPCESAPLEPLYEQQIVSSLDSLGNEAYDTILVEVPQVDPLAVEAYDAAETIKELRDQRYKILIGDTDASYAGEALGAALAELTKLEAELLPLFEGSTETVKGRAWFDIIPDRAGTVAAFAMDPVLGPVRATKSSTEIFDLIIEAEPVAEAESQPEPETKGKKQPQPKLIHYRIPAICTVTLSDGRQEITSLRMPVYQLGLEATYPVYE